MTNSAHFDNFAGPKRTPQFVDGKAAHRPWQYHPLWRSSGRSFTLRKETEAWWRQAQADLHTAEWNAEGGIYYASSWFAHQAAEKALKALWIERRRVEPPRTHAVQFLGRELVVPSRVQTDLDALAPVFAQARYPEFAGRSPIDSITAGASRDHLAAAGRILAWSDRKLQPPPNQP